ncbi:MAG: Transcriptional regulator, IclR family [Firmicutes bacterium]|nr:Transcriptional regulator, IclR family [Bacillota bacterium]MDI6707004.1 IclR family transcriptional regulator [Bacillota bacterium]
MGKDAGINSIVRAIDILELYGHHERELGISEIARRLNLYKSTVHRIVATLEKKDILEQNRDTGKYRLGLKLYKIGITARDGNELIAISMPHLKELTRRTGETSNLVVMDGSMSMYLAQEESSRMVRMFTRVGARVLPHCNGAGKVLLAQMPQDQLEAVIAENGLKEYTKNTIRRREDLIRELKEVREKGFAVDNQEREEGVKCIAAGVKNRTGRVVAAVSISGPVDRFGDNRMGELVEMVKKCAASISTELGYIGD